MAATLGPRWSQKPVCFSGSASRTQVSLLTPPSCAETSWSFSLADTRVRPPGIAAYDPSRATAKARMIAWRGPI